MISYRRKSLLATTSARSSKRSWTRVPFFEVKPLFAPELVTGFALLEGEVIGIVANQPAVKGGVLFVDSADKGARFIWQCDAFSIPLLYLGRRAGIHDRQCCGAARHHPARREDDHRGRGGYRTDGLVDHPEGVRGWALCDGWPGVRAGRLPGAADRQDRGDGS